MQEINLYSQVAVKLNEVGIKKLENYLWGLAKYKPSEINEILEEIKENKSFWQTELWRFMKVFGEDISKSEEDRGFYLTQILIKNSKTSLWYILRVNKVASVHLTDNGLKRLNDYTKEAQNESLPHQKENIQESMLRSISKPNRQRLFLWEIIKIYGSEILNHPFIQNEIVLEEELLLAKESSYYRNLIPNETSASYLKEMAMYLKKLKEGQSIEELYQSILKKNNIKYISRRGLNHSIHETSTSNFLESEDTFHLERDLTSLIDAIKNSEMKEQELPLPIKKRLLKY